MSKFIADGYLPISRDRQYNRAKCYNRRVWAAEVAAQRRGGLIDMSVYRPRPGELACEVHDPDSSEGVQVVKHRFIEQMLGFVPVVEGARQ
jgi:hypothetical protein